MQIFPPYTHWKTIVKDPVLFHAYLKTRIETNSTNRQADLEGIIEKEFFRASLKSTAYNYIPPFIQGVLSKNSNDEIELSMSIHSPKLLKILFALFVIIAILICLVNQSLQSLIAIPVFILFWSGWFYVFHLASIEQTKKTIIDFLKEAKKEH
jgi:hypothetical protein